MATNTTVVGTRVAKPKATAGPWRLLDQRHPPHSRVGLVPCIPLFVASWDHHEELWELNALTVPLINFRGS